MSPDKTNHHVAGPEEVAQQVHQDVEEVAVELAVVGGDDIHQDHVVKGEEAHKDDSFNANEAHELVHRALQDSH